LLSASQGAPQCDAFNAGTWWLCAFPIFRSSTLSFIVSESGFSDELDKFIAAEIQSLEQLEILLLLSGNPHKWWSAKSVYDVIKSSPASVEDRLSEMAATGMLRKETDGETRYQFCPANDVVWRIVNELRDAYKERSVKVVQAIYSKPPDAVQEFARAFRVRKES
jgi:hypothetical protein